MDEVVCDTMIWYELGRGGIKKDLVEDRTLIFTGLCTYELATTQRMLYGIDAFKAACRAITEYSDKKILQMSYEYLLDLQYDNFRLKDAFQRLEKIAKNPELFVPENRNIEKAIEAIEKEKSAFEPYITHLNKSAKEIQSRLGNDPALREKHKSIDNIDAIKKMIQQECDSWATSSNINRKEVDFNNFELFIKIFDKWFKQLELGEKTIAKINDWFDVHNMVYVNPSMKYYTYDKKWIWMIRDCGLEHYLFKDDFVEQKLKENLPQKKSV